MTKYTQNDYDAATQLHNHASQRRRFASSEHLSGRMTSAQYLEYAKAEKFALAQWEAVRAELFPGT